MILEGKREPGEDGGDPAAQCISYFALGVENADGTTAYASTFMPSAGLTVCGQDMRQDPPHLVHFFPRHTCIMLMIAWQ